MPKKTLEYYYRLDCHFTPKGYDFAAKEIEKEVRIIKGNATERMLKNHK